MVLEVREVAKSFGGVRAVDGASLAVRERTIHGLIGPNGAGKSTLVDIVTGRVKPDRGTVLLGGSDVTGRRPWRIRRQGVGRSFQKISLFPGLSVGEQLEAATATREHARELAESLGLARLWDAPAGALPYGLQRRVDIALALGGATTLLVLDEPAAGLAADEAARLGDDLVDLARRTHLSVLLIEHDLDLVFGICDEVTVLHLGQVITSGPTDEVRDHPVVRAVYIGEGSVA